MNRPQSPCRHCKRRRAECHGSCELYKFWQEELETYNKFTKSRKAEENPAGPEYSDYRIKRMRGES